jgi:hypothetical protein
MSTTATFSEADLRAIRRTFLTRKATPEEIRLVLRPKQRSWQMLKMAWWNPVFLALPMWPVARHVLMDIEHFGGRLVPDFWATCCLLILLHVLTYVLLPGAFVARFELVLHPGNINLGMAGLGFEQRRHAGCCAIVNRRLWCNFLVEMIPYALLRRWWQLPLPLGAGAAAIERILKPANQALRDSLQAGGSRAALMGTSRRTLLAKAFGEAIVTDNEIVLLLPPAGGWFLIGSLLGVCGGYWAAMLWTWLNEPWITRHDELGRFICELRGTPLWLPAAIAFLITAIFFLLADPWVRRALAVVPRGQRLLQIWKGGRARGEYPWEENHIYIADWRNHETLASQLYVKTRAWSGWKPAQRHFDEYTMAMYALDAWAMGQPIPWENEDG